MDCNECQCLSCENTDCVYTMCERDNPREICFENACIHYMNQEEDLEEGFYDGYSD
ncbi:MAG: hypothetical protein PHP50_10085 [Lachnospiraceae bacterium]|nr:hypothetical protein [Lachnospiraceae bacterium]